MVFLLLLLRRPHICVEHIHELTAATDRWCDHIIVFLLLAIALHSTSDSKRARLDLAKHQNDLYISCAFDALCIFRTCRALFYILMAISKWAIKCDRCNELPRGVYNMFDWPFGKFLWLFPEVVEKVCCNDDDLWMVFYIISEFNRLWWDVFCILLIFVYHKALSLAINKCQYTNQCSCVFPDVFVNPATPAATAIPSTFRARRRRARMAERAASPTPIRTSASVHQVSA